MPVIGQRAIAITGVMLLGAVAAPSALASQNVGPSSAVAVQPGVPFSGTWKGTPRLHGGFTSHWWRSGSLVRTGDTVQLAVDNTAGEYTTYFCLIPPVDEFGADAAQRDCEENTETVSAGRLSRFVLTYNGATGQPYVAALASGFAGEEDDGGPYTATIEKVTTRVNIGAVPPTSLGRTFSYAATLRYGDNTPVADGSGAVLEWRRARGTPGPEGFTPLASASSIGGEVVFNAALPAEARDKVQLRACAAQPGGDPRCTAAAAVAVDGAASGKSVAWTNAERTRRVLQRRARKLTRKVRAARRLSVRRSYIRKRRATTRRLKIARRQATLRCL